MNDDDQSGRIIERIERGKSVPNLVNVLAERLDPTDLQSLLLEVYRRRAAQVTPSRLLDRYERDRFARPSDLAPNTLLDLERPAWSLLPDAYRADQLAPHVDAITLTSRMSPLAVVPRGRA